MVRRRYLIVPGIRSSRIYVIDVKEPLKAAKEIFEKTGYSRPYSIHCGPEGTGHKAAETLMRGNV